jgi:hypothetical protein
MTGAQLLQYIDGRLLTALLACLETIEIMCAKLCLSAPAQNEPRDRGCTYLVSRAQRAMSGTKW